jgi:hypothetical protein
MSARAAPIRFLPHLVLLFSLFLLGACAGTPGTARSVMALPDASELDRYRNLHVELEAAGEDVRLTRSDGERIAMLVQEKIRQQRRGRFTALEDFDGAPDTLRALIRIKRYDEGSAFARAMLAGLGQIHINADVLLSDVEREEPFAEYAVSKTFAWGGLYGASTRISDVEHGFADAVARAILGERVGP